MSITEELDGYVDQITHIPSDRELQVSPALHRLPESDVKLVATTIGARKDVANAWVGPDGFIHVRYSGSGSETFIRRLKRGIVNTLLHKAAVPGAGSTRSTRSTSKTRSAVTA
jgi:hypothetical protein